MILQSGLAIEPPNYTPKDRKMAHDTGWNIEAWGLVEWALSALWVVGGALGLFFWRLSLKVMMMEEYRREVDREIGQLREGTRELVGEMRQLRQTLESTYRELNRQIIDSYNHRR